MMNHTNQRSIFVWRFLLIIASTATITTTHAFSNIIVNPSKAASSIKNHGSVVGKNCCGLTTRSSSSLNLKYIDKSNIDDTVIELTPEQDQILRNSVSSLTEKYGPGWFELSDAWDTLRAEYPVEFGTLTNNDDLKKVYLRQSPNNPLDLLTQTPLGPFIVINLLFYFTGFTWCDTPFHADGACPP